MQLGVNAWVWTSPVNTEEFGKLAPKVKQMGFDLFEFGIESTSDLDYARAATIARDNGLGVSVCAAMGPDRDLIHADGRSATTAWATSATASTPPRRSAPTNVVGPIYSAVGRTWQSTDEERKKDTDLLVNQLKKLSAYAGDQRRHALRRAAQPLRDELHEPRAAGD